MDFVCRKKGASRAGVSATGTHNWNVLFLMILAVLFSAHDGDRWTRKSGPQKLIKFILALAVLFAFNWITFAAEGNSKTFFRADEIEKVFWFVILFASRVAVTDSNEI